MKSEEIISVLNICHDGTITGYQIENDSLKLEVEIDCLTSRLTPQTKYLELKINGASNLTLETWPRDKELNPDILTNPELIFQYDLDILSAEEKESAIWVYVDVDSPESKYCGGLLRFYAKGIQIRTGDGILLDIVELQRISKEYWENFERGKSSIN